MGCGEPLKALSGLNEHKGLADSSKSSKEMKQARKRESGNGVVKNSWRNEIERIND